MPYSSESSNLPQLPEVAKILVNGFERLLSPVILRETPA